MMLELRSEKLILQRSQLMVSLYDWLCLFAIIAASFLYTTLAVGPIPPDTVNTSGERDPCWYLRFMLVFTIHAGIYDPCWYLWSAVCVKTQDDAGIYDSCWYLHFMLVFTIPA